MHHQILSQLDNLLNTKENNRRLIILIEKLFVSFRNISDALRNNECSCTTIGTHNSFGESQLDIDIRTDEMIFNALKESNVVHIGSSEESPTEIDCLEVNKWNLKEDEGFSMGFDPLDGSSIVGCNFAIGTICGIWSGKGLIGQKCKDLVCSIMVIYGPKTIIVLSFNDTITRDKQKKCIEITMSENGWYMTNPSFLIDKKEKYYSPGNLAATVENTDYKRVHDFWLDNKYKLRYSGGLVPDVYHILIKKTGVFTNFSSDKHKAKLRLIYEILPIGLIIESAGGKSFICNENELHDEISSDKVIDNLEERVNVCYGSIDEVKKFINIYYNKENVTNLNYP
jgi:sedoheptulose-bisphosphatase